VEDEMNYFNYRAVDSIGNNFKGTIHAEDDKNARRKLMENGLIILELEKLSIIRRAIENMSSLKISNKFVSVFCRQLQIILKSGVSVLKGLSVMKEQSENKKNRAFMDKLYSEVQKGRSLSEAMRDSNFQVPFLLTNMIAIGEESGNLEEVLLRMAVYFEKENYLKSKVIGAMIYPAIMALISVGLVIFFMTFVMPEIMGVFQETEAELPAMTLFVLSITDFIKNYLVITLVAIIVLMGLIKLFVPNQVIRGIRGKVFFKLPIIKDSIKDIVTTRFLRNLGLMLRAGVPIVTALQGIAKVMDNVMLEKLINSAIEGIKRGDRLGDNFSKYKYFDPVVIHMINIGQETGQLDEIMDTMAEHYERQSEIRLMKMTAAMEPIMIVFLGIAMGFLVVAMILPMFDMLGSMRG
jgi:type IV pilus assembly protein PilC